MARPARQFRRNPPGEHQGGAALRRRGRLPADYIPIEQSRARFSEKGETLREEEEVRTPAWWLRD
jgi:hypothetical protein